MPNTRSSNRHSKKNKNLPSNLVITNPTASSNTILHELFAGSNLTSMSPLPPSATIGQVPHLEEVLRAQGSYETAKGLEIRRESLKSLNLLVRQWIQSIRLDLSLSRGIHWNDVHTVGGRIVTYGSYMLGISHQGADIDALCIAPVHVTRAEYFKSFYHLLSIQHEVTELRAIEEAYVPVLKFRYNGIEIDMTFAKLNLQEVPGQELHADSAVAASLLQPNAMQSMDAKCIRSLNGYRSTIELLQLVPNKEVFQTALRAIKLWAKANGLYSNILGYLGGFSWAVLVAKICIDLYNLGTVEANAVDVIKNFFDRYSSWEWPNPVTLIDIEPKTAIQNAQMEQVAASANLTSWNPKRNPMDSFHVMPILTTTYPLINSTFNVTATTRDLIRDKMFVAKETCDQILHGKAKWQELFKTCHIFHDYEHFLCVMASATHPLQWFGLIESKIRYFVTKIESETSLKSVRIWPKPFTKRNDKTNEVTQFWFIGLSFKKEEDAEPEASATPEIDMAKLEADFSAALTTHTKTFQDQLLYQAQYQGKFFRDDMKIEVHFVRKGSSLGDWKLRGRPDYDPGIYHQSWTGRTKVSLQCCYCNNESILDYYALPRDLLVEHDERAVANRRYYKLCSRSNLSDHCPNNLAVSKMQKHNFLWQPQRDLTRHLTERDIQEIVFSQSQKRESHHCRHHHPQHKRSSSCSSSNGSISYAAAVTKSSSYLSAGTASVVMTTTNNKGSNVGGVTAGLPIMPHLGVGATGNGSGGRLTSASRLPLLNTGSHVTPIMPPTRSHSSRMSRIHLSNHGDHSAHMGSPPVTSNLQAHMLLSEKSQHSPRPLQLMQYPSNLWRCSKMPAGDYTNNGGGGGKMSAKVSSITASAASSSCFGNNHSMMSNNKNSSGMTSASAASQCCGGHFHNSSLVNSTSVGSDFSTPNDIFDQAALASSNGSDSILDISYSSMDSDNGRSVSYSSDKFPPHSLVQARLQHHSDKIPFSPYSPISPFSFDASVPPPPPSPAGLHPKPADTMNPMTRTSRQSRISSSEIKDVSTPLPVQPPMQLQPLRFNFATTGSASSR